jgi:hypothetical protein
MAPIVTSVDIPPPPAEVFSYVTDPSKFSEWRVSVVEGHNAGDDALRRHDRAGIDWPRNRQSSDADDDPSAARGTTAKLRQAAATAGAACPMRMLVMHEMEPDCQATNRYGGR